MPKIIENVREQLLAEAKKQILENGYARTTVRSVAKACSLAVGTVYNYFPSKDMLIASFMMEDWQICMAQIATAPKKDAEKLFFRIYESLVDFEKKYRALFNDADAAKAFTAVFSERHEVLIDKLAEYIRPVCPDDCEDKEYLSRFIAEAFLNRTMIETPYDKLFSVLIRLVKNNNCKE